MKCAQLRMAKSRTPIWSRDFQTTEDSSSSSIAGTALIITVSTRICVRLRSKPGDQVKRGQRIGVMGHTGEGIDRERAHVHLELNLMLSPDFQSWYDVYFHNDPNRHGIYNGLNLVGIDVARLYLALRKNPALTIPEFLSQETIFYKVTVPNAKHFDLAKRYPWLSARFRFVGQKSWEISFAQSGVPLRVEPSARVVAGPELTYFKRSSGNYSQLTRNALTGHGDRAALSESGKRLMQLLVFPD